MSAQSRLRRPRPPLNSEKLQEMAIRYVGRFATSRAKLQTYLQRKVRERGWDGPRPPDFDGLIQRFCNLGYVDDAAYALSKSQSLTTRGYGKRRVDEKLRIDGIDEEDSAAARALADGQAVDSALRFAKRRRIGPFATAPGDPKIREKAIAALVRAGHDFTLARALADMPPATDIDLDRLRERLIND